MMGDMDEIDLEELEERLYSQIYHSTNAEEPQIPQEPQNEEIPRQSYGKPRYYENNPSAVCFENKTQEQLTNRNDGHNTANDKPLSQINDENVNPCLNSSEATGLNSSLNVSVNQPNNSFDIPQFIEISSKGEISSIDENTTLKPPNRISHLSRRARSRAKKKLDTEIKYLNTDKSKILENYEFIKQTAPYKLKKLKIINKRLRYLLNKRMRLKDDKAEKLINKHNEELDKEVVQISSDDDDMTIIIKEKSPVKKTKVEKVQDDDDDVVFVKQIFSKIETIVIDPETSQKTDSELMKPPSDVETSSVGSSNSSNLDKSTKTQSQIELLGTPDSTNDFLDNPVEMNRVNFNFALHGPEFGTPQSSKFLKPKPLNEVYESESSCSASDISTPYKKYTCVFSENEFDSSKEMFNESNLETFSKLITPKRKPAAAKRIETQTSEFEQVKTKVNSTSGKTNSDSSSESEYEDSKVQEIERKKNLNLSSSLTEDLATEIPVEVEEKNSKKKNKKSMQIEEVDDHTKFLQDLTDKRRKRRSELMDKMDDESGQEENVLESTAKKSKKNKGKAVVDNVDIEDNVEKEEDVNVKRRRKTRTDFAEDLVNAIKEDNMCKDSSPMKSNSGDFYIDESSMQDVVEVVNPQSNNLVDLTVDDTDILDITDFIVIDECGDSGGEDKKPDVQCTEPNWETEVVKLKSSGKSNGKKKSKKKWGFMDFWTEDMNKFYGSWGLEDFNVEDCLKTMSGDPKKWKILDSDRLHIPTYRRGPVCRKCGKPGHVYTRAGYCPNAIPKCFLCGESGHFEPRCPNRICTMCGVKSNYSTNYCSKCVYLRQVRCQICNMVGHKAEMCPDTWRRYHLTTEEGPVVIPERKDRLKPVEKQWCSGCASSGHLEYQCRYLNRMYLSTVPYVVDYTDVYGFSQEPEESPIDFTEDVLNSTYINDPTDTVAKGVDHKIRTKRINKRNNAHYAKFLANLHVDKKRKGDQKQFSSLNCLDNSISGESLNVTNINNNDRKPKKAPFKGFPSNPSDIALKISTSLNNLQDWNSRENCFSIYDNILNLENSPDTTNKEDLAQNFIKLNSLLITKYKVVGSKGQKHLNILRSWLEQNRGTTVKDVLNHSLVNTIRNSYYYIFDAHRKKFNYKVLLGKIKTSEFPDARNVTFTLNDIGGGMTSPHMGSKKKRRRYFNSKRLKQLQFYHV